MPKITVHGGPTNDGETVPTEEVASSAGSSSSTSTPSSQTEQPEATTSKQPSAPTTANRSGKARGGSSTARSTDTGRAVRSRGSKP